MKKVKEMSEEEVQFHPYYALMYWKIVALFKDDPEITVLPVDDEKHLCTIQCKTQRKKDLLEKWMKLKFTSEGSEELDVKITLDPNANVIVQELNELFSTNKHFEKAYSYEKKPDPLAPGFRTVVMEMKDEAIHYFSDNMFNPSEYSAELGEDIVRELFNPELVTFPVVTHMDGTLTATFSVGPSPFSLNSIPTISCITKNTKN